MSQWKPGDVVMTTHLALAAVWWYGMIPISDEAGAGSALRDGSPVYEMGPTTDCPSRQLEDALKNRRRVLCISDSTPSRVSNGCWQRISSSSAD
jgi:hypothetical protein